MEQEDHYMEQFKLKRLIKRLQEAEGDGTSLITLVIPAGKRVSDYQQMLTDEMGKAEQIKDRVNRLSVLDALVSTKEVLKNQKLTVENGLCVFCGKIKVPGQKTIKKIKIVFEPFKAVKTKVYNCGDKFDTAVLERLLESHETYGFAIIDGNGILMGKLQGNSKTILARYDVDLPKKHNKGGQSSNRFAHIRQEKRLIYTKRCCEEIKKTFITNNRPNVSGLVLGGYADFKNNVFENNTFDIRLKPIVVKILDLSYGGEKGFNQAISMSKDTLKNVRLVQEQEMLRKFMDHINRDTNMIVFGVNDTMKSLQELAVETLILYEDLDYYIVDLIPEGKGKEETVQKYLRFKDIQFQQYWTDKEKNEKYTIVDYEPLIDVLGEKFKDYKTEIFYVSDLSPEGHQFANGFAGIGGILKFKTEGQIVFSEDSDYDVDDFI